MEEDLLLQGKTVEARVGAAAAIRDYLRALAQARRAQPVDDLISFAVQAKVNGELLTDDEILGICYLLFVGGLDTVASSLGFYFKYLAENPEQQRMLRENNALIPDAVEELLRVHSVVMVRPICHRRYAVRRRGDEAGRLHRDLHVLRELRPGRDRAAGSGRLCALAESPCRIFLWTSSLHRLASSAPRACHCD